MIVIIKLDYTIESPEERNELVKQILAETPEPTEQYLEILADYIMLAVERQERKSAKKYELLTDNRMVTISSHETSFEGLVGQLENGEDGIYNLMSENNNKNVIFKPKVTITKKDLEEIPPLRQLRDGIEHWEQLQKTATGRDAFIIKKALIEMRKDQYIIKNAYRRPIIFTKITRGSGNFVKLPFDEWIDEETGNPAYSGASFLDPEVVSIILCNFEQLKHSGEGKFIGDTFYLMYDFENLMNRALADYPLYKRIVDYKMDGHTNIEIQKMIEKEFGYTHSLEYISSLWRNKIPKLIASTAADEWIIWYYTEVEKGKWKKCSRCGEIKLAHSRFFSINKTSKDGWYSICKKCRSAKKKN